MALAQEKCLACRRDSPRVTDQEIDELLPQIPLWTLTEMDQIKRLERTIRFRCFQDAMAFSNAVAEIAEQAGHHPRIITEWGRVNIAWWTHKIQGLHRNDFVMAARTDALDCNPMSETTS